MFNTIGYSYFAERMLGFCNYTIKVGEICGLKDVALPAELLVPKSLPKSEGFEVLAQYKSQQDSAIYAVRERLDSGEIIYVNLHPLIEVIKLSGDKSIYFNVFGKLLDL